MQTDTLSAPIQICIERSSLPGPAATGREVRWDFATVALLLAFLAAPGAQTEKREGIVGLLKLPHLFGEGCKEPPKLEVPIYAEPQTAAVVGWIRAGRHESSDNECYRVVLNFHRRSDASIRALPVVEHEEDQPDAAIVVETRDRWVKLRLPEGAAWIEVRQYDDYLSLEQLLRRRQAYLTGAWDRTLAATPRGKGRRAPGDPRRHLIGYVEPILEGLRMVLGPQQDPEEIRRRHHASSMRWWPGANGTRIVYIERGTEVRAAERPNRRAPVIATFLTNECDRRLRSTGANPAQVAVFDRRPGWLQVALREVTWKDDRRVWIEDAPVWRFHAFATEAERRDLEDELFGLEHPTVRFIRSRTVDGRLWLYVAVMSHTIYESVEPRVVAAGWVPAHDTAGRSVVWFYSRD